MRGIAAIVEYDIASVKREIASAWSEYKKTERYGLKFGEICYEWQQKLATKGGCGTKGKGLVQVLDELNVAKSTVYWWIDRYKESAGIAGKKEVVQPGPTPEHLKEVRELRDWIKAECPEIYTHLQPSAHGIIERGKDENAKSVFDLELRSVTSAQVKLVCEVLRKRG